LITDRWLNRFSANILAEPKSITQWPTLQSQQTHTGQWIKREQQHSLFSKEALIKLEHAHEEAHIIAQTLLLKYQSGEIDTAREGPRELQSAFDKMRAVLEAM